MIQLTGQVFSGVELFLAARRSSDQQAARFSRTGLAKRGGIGHGRGPNGHLQLYPGFVNTARLSA